MDPKIDFFENGAMSFGYSQCCICRTLGLPKLIPKRNENQSSHQEASWTSLLNIRTVLLPHFAELCENGIQKGLSFGAQFIPKNTKIQQILKMSPRASQMSPQGLKHNKKSTFRPPQFKKNKKKMES